MTKTAMPIHPVRTREDHRAAVARIEVLMNAPAGSPEADELDILATLVDAFEAKHDPIDLPDPIAVIEFRMDQQQLSRKDLVTMIGSRGRVSEVLAGKRNTQIVGFLAQLRGYKPPRLPDISLHTFGGSGTLFPAASTSKLSTVNFFNCADPKLVVIATSVASRPTAINTRPMRSSL